MKKISTLLAALFVCLGMARAQEVYYAGNGNGTGKIWKNDSIILSITDSASVNLTALQITADGRLFSAGYVIDTASVKGRVWLNDSVVFDAGTNTAVSSLWADGSQWYAVGYGENEWEGIAGWIWHNGEPLHSFNDSLTSNPITALAIDTATGDVYVGGRSNDYATVWKNDTILWQLDHLSAVNAIHFDGEGLYAAGVDYSDGIHATLWLNDSVIFSIAGEETESEFTAMAFYDGSVYLGGNIDSTLFVWQDGEVVYSHPSATFSEIKALFVDASGVYYAGMLDSVATVWKDGEVLYQTEDCDGIAALVVLPATPLPSFTLTAEADSTAWGTVVGGGTYHLGDTATIEAIANDGYAFLQWNDSITDNPRTVVITCDTAFVAHFGLMEYNIVATVDPEEAGTVSMNGTTHYGDTLLMEALPNAGFEFRMWNDSVTDNPRSIVVEHDSTFTALFDRRQFTIEVVSDHPSWGSVSGGGTFYFGDTIQISASPNLGFAFAGWNDSIYANPRTVVVTEDQSFTAHFEIRQCYITTKVTPEGTGSVTGGGSYNYGETVNLIAHGNAGYVFDAWDDGVINNPRIILVEGDATYTAVFRVMQYEITTECQPAEGGSVTGGGTYSYGETATLTARPANNYTFVCWSDGITSNPRNVVVTHTATYKALFQQQGTPQYVVKVSPNDPTLGSVTGDGEYPEGAIIEISATPAPNAYFKGWDDGNNDNPRSVLVDENKIFVALFELIPTYTITVRSQSAQMGTVYGSGTYQANTVINIGATANEGYYFSGWQDGDMNNPRSITVTEDATYIATFSEEPVLTYTVTVYYDENQGFILGTGTYPAGSTATIVAIPADGYFFVKWSDNTTDNRKEVYVDHDIELAAFFNGTSVDESGLEAVSLYPNPANDKINIEGLEGQYEAQIYNAYGMLVKTLTLNGDSEIGIEGLSAGLYVIRIGQHAMRFVKR